jgi:hypothetical protein
MPIKRLSGRKGGYAVIGKLRKGGPKQQRQGNKGAYEIYGKELDHWRFTSETPGVKEAFDRIYGAEPQSIEVYLPYAEKDRNWQCWQEEWSASSLVHRCDGETCVRWLKGDGTYSEEPKPCPGKCNEVGRLMVILPDLVHEGFVGPIIVETHSVHDIVSIEGALDAVIAARGADDLYGVGFTLRRVPREISAPDPKQQGKRMRTRHWLIELAPSREWVQRQISMARHEALALPDPLMAERQRQRDNAPPSDALRLEADSRMGPPGLSFDGGPAFPEEDIIEADEWGELLDDREVLPDEEAAEDEPSVQDVTKSETSSTQPAPKAPQPEPEEPKERPYPPEFVVKKVQKAFQEYAEGGDGPAAKGIMGAVVGCLDGLFEEEPKEIQTAKRHGLLRAFFGINSSKDLTEAQCKALLRWASEKITENGTTIYAPAPYAVKEAAEIIKARDVAAGQRPLGF